MLQDFYAIAIVKLTRKKYTAESKYKRFLSTMKGFNIAVEEKKPGYHPG